MWAPYARTTADKERCGNYAFAEPISREIFFIFCRRSNDITPECESTYENSLKALSISIPRYGLALYSASA